MSNPNQIYEGGFYNEYQKKRYLETLPKQSVSAAERILSRVKILEEQFNTDLYNFNLYQIEKFLHYLAPSTLTASRIHFYGVQSYIRWGIEQDLRDNNLNPLEILSDTTYLKKFIDQSKQRFYTKDEIDKMTSICVNAQDAAPILLIFNGVFGSQGYDELLNLQGKHFLSEDTLELWDGDKGRVLKIDDPNCMRVARQALNDKTYLKKNGNASESMRAKPEIDLVDNDFVLKNVRTRNKGDGKADKHLVLRRIAAVKDYNDDWVKDLTPYIIRQSGMLYRAYQLYKECGKLEKEQIETVCRQFNIKKVKNGKHEVYNVHHLKSDFLNEETIKALYGIEE